MNRVLESIFFAALFFCCASTQVFAQRTNYTEDDVVIMKDQQSVGENIMRLLERKQVDSALQYFKKKDAATKKSLTTIANDIQKHKTNYTLEVAADAKDDFLNYCYCKYTANEGETVVYKVIFVFGRTDREYKVEKIIFK